MTRFFCWKLEKAESRTYVWVESKGRLEEGVDDWVGDATKAGLV